MLYAEIVTFILCYLLLAVRMQIKHALSSCHIGRQMGYANLSYFKKYSSFADQMYSVLYLCKKEVACGIIYNLHDCNHCNEIML